MRFSRLLKFTAALSLMSVCAAYAQEPRSRLTVMAYNVENFFDAVDDPRMPNGPSAEVINTPEWVAAKGSAIARVIQRFDFGTGPDILVLAEVESQSALDAIRASLIDGGADYRTAVLVDADPNRPNPKPDLRGIKLAILSKLPLTGTPRSVPVDLTATPECNRTDGTPGVTRDLLLVDLKLPDGQTLTVIGAHLTSGGSPRICREIGAKTIAKVAATLPATNTVIAAGDFNFNCAPAERKGLKESLPGWVLPSQLDNGCHGMGSQYYWREKTWSYLDVITQKPQPQAGNWVIDARTFRIVQDDFEQFFWDEEAKVLRPKGFRYNPETKKATGVADHFPIAIDLIRTQP